MRAEALSPLPARGHKDFSLLVVCDALNPRYRRSLTSLALSVERVHLWSLKKKVSTLKSSSLKRKRKIQFYKKCALLKQDGCIFHPTNCPWTQVFWICYISWTPCLFIVLPLPNPKLNLLQLLQEMARYGKNDRGFMPEKS